VNCLKCGGPFGTELESPYFCVNCEIQRRDLLRRAVSLLTEALLDIDLSQRIKPFAVEFFPELGKGGEE